MTLTVTAWLDRHRTLVAGLTGFAAATIVTGLATSLAMVLAAHAAQAVCGAVMAGPALSLLNVTVAEPTDRRTQRGRRATDETLLDAGDDLQAEARVLTQLLRGHEIDIPYDAFQALLAVEDAAGAWTRAKGTT